MSLTLQLRTGPILAGLLFAACASPQPVALSNEEPIERCPWGSAIEAGRLDPVIVNEASGLAVSARFADRLYHVNDSGDSGRFYVTDLQGRGTEIVEIESFEPRDVEDLALGGCGTRDGTCLFIADIGDNNRTRDQLQIVVVEEQEVFPARVTAVETIRFRYREGPQDAESLGLHPNGDLYIVTKTADYGRETVAPSRIYRLGLDARREAGGSLLVLDPVGQIELDAISSDSFSGSLPTAMDISPDGSHLLLLTYVNAFEFFVDLSSGTFPPMETLVEGLDVREVLLETLNQQESIAYLNGDSFLYDTEAVDGTARIMRVECR